MLRFTRAGAVADPRTVQIRVAPEYPGRVVAGAPRPRRAMTLEEIATNIHWFAVERAGPRTATCQTVVLSAVGGVENKDAATLVERARSEWSVERFVVHLARNATDQLAVQLSQQVDVLVRSITGPGPIPPVSPGCALHLVVPLTERTLSRLDALVASAVAASPERVVLSWPFPGASPPPQAASCSHAVARALEALDAAGIGGGLKGLPLCALGPGGARWRHRVWRSANRWYVDAEHQKEKALMFFPDVVRFGRRDSCRFCAVTDRCDGVAERWLKDGRAGGLEPLGHMRPDQDDSPP